MSVNYDIWGAQGTWIDGNSSQQKADIKFPATDKDTYRENWQREAMEWNTIDLSACFYGINKEAVWCNPHYLAPYAVGGNINTIDVYEELIPEEKQTQPLILGYLSSGSTLSVSYTRRWRSYEMADIRTGTPVGNGYSEAVVMSFNYQKIMAIPYVVVIPNTYRTGAYTTKDLYSYIEEEDYLTNQRIIGIGYRLRFGDGETNRTSSEMGLAPLFNFDIPGKNVAYNDKHFFAHSEGMSMLMWSDRTHSTVMGIETERVYGDATVGTADTGFRFKYCISNDGNSVPIYFYNSDDEFANGTKVWTVGKETYAGSGTTVYWQSYPYIAVNATNAEEVKKYIMKQVAYLGLPFVYNPDDASQGKIGEIGVFLPVFDEDGITTGDYKEGIDALRLPNSEWTDSRDGSGYDPDKQNDDEDLGIKVKPSTPAFTLASHGTKCYALIESDIDEIFDDIYGRSSSSWSKLIKGLQMFGSDPMGAIISFKWYPFSFSSTINSAVYLGNTAINPVHQYPVIDSTTNSYKSTKATYKWDVSRNFVNSRKTTCRLYLPFYGFYELPVPLIISKTLSVQMSYNVPDEIAVWIISFDDVIYDFVECDPSIDIPLTGSNAAQIALTKRNTALSIATQVGATAAAIAVGATMQAPALGAAIGELGAIYSGAGTIGGVIQSLPWLESSSIAALAGGGAAAAGIGAGAAASGANILNKISNAKLQIGHLMTNLPYHGAASSTTFLNLPMYPYIQFIQNIKMAGWDEPQYKLKVGYACDVWRTMLNMPEESLLQTTGSADMSAMGMELAEIEELNAILQSGFYR